MMIAANRENRRVGWLAVACAALALPSAAEAKPKKVRDENVQVDGDLYRVAVYDNGGVLVARKAMVVVYDLDERARQRQAAKIATGCNLVDELPNGGAKTMGKLECPPEHKAGE